MTWLRQQLQRLAGRLQRILANRRGYILLRFPFVWALGVAVAGVLRLITAFAGDRTGLPTVRHAYECTYPSGELTRIGGRE